jgi:hypothetical protein
MVIFINPICDAARNNVAEKRFILHKLSNWVSQRTLLKVSAGIGKLTLTVSFTQEKI